MYELKNGSKRLACALHDMSCNKHDMAILTRLLNYYEPQLAEDIQALYDLLIIEKSSKEGC